MTRKIIINLISLTIFTAPYVVFAGLVPDCGVFSNGVIEKECNFDDLMQLINNIINYLLFIIATPLAALIIIYAGVLYVFDGGSESRVNQAKGILRNVIFGYVIALSAWLIVKAILIALGFEGGRDFINY